jgi:hypothetical protein
MTEKVASAFRAHADHWSQRSNSTTDENLKRFWDELADDWLALESKQKKIDAKWRALRHINCNTKSQKSHFSIFRTDS